MARILIPLFLCAWLLVPKLDAQTPPETFFAVHCEPNNGNPVNFQALRGLVDAAEARNARLSIEFGVTWVQMILADAGMLAQVRAWEANGHAIGAHHHGVTHPFWDGFTDLQPSQVQRPEPWLGTMADFKAIVDPLFGPEGLQFGGIQDSEREWPYGVPWQTDGGRDPANAVVVPEMRIRNKYGVWHIDHAYMADPAMLAQLKTLHDQTHAPEVFGVVTHAVDYRATPWIFENWFDFLQSKDPTGAYNKTVPEILFDKPLPLRSDVSSLSAATGGRIRLDLTTAPSLAGTTYQFLFSLSGTSPGLDYGGVFDDGVHIGINPDNWTDFSMTKANSVYLPGFAGILGAQGEARAEINTLGSLRASFIGRSISIVAVALSGSDVEFSSNAVRVQIDP